MAEVRSPRTTTHLVGRALVNDDVKGAVDAYIGNPIEGEPEGVFRARKLYDEGDIEAALEAMPPSMRYERMMLQPILRDLRRDGITEESYIKAIQVLPKPLKRIFVHAYQSYLFNRAVSERLPSG